MVGLRRVVPALLSGMLLLAGCASSSTGNNNNEQVSKKPRVTVGAGLEPTTLDLTSTSAAAIPQVLRDNVYQGLVKLDDDNNVVPELAKSWDLSSDNTVYTFHLHTGVKWHDGNPFTADDVVYSIKAVLGNSAPKHPFLSQMSVVSDVTAVDDSTVKVTLKQFSFNWLFYLTQSVGIIFEKKALSALGDEKAIHDALAKGAIGTGPFKFDSWVHGDHIKLVRNKDYYGTRPRLDEVVFKYITDANALNNALLAGDIDVISQVAGPEQLKGFKDNSKFKVLEGVTNGKVLLSINNTRKPLNDVRVRQAITYAIDRDALIQGVQDGHGIRIGSHVSTADPWYIDLNSTYPFDVSKAKALMAQAGYSGSKRLSLTLTLPPRPYATRSGEIIQSALKDIGIDVKIANVEFAQWLSQVFTQGNFDLTIIAHVEPRDIAQYGNAKYYWHYDNPQVKDWLAQADRTSDEASRNDLYAKVQRQITGDAVNDWLFLLPALEVTREEISGYPTNQLGPAIDMSKVSASG